MQTPALSEIKKSLLSLEPHELSALCLRLARYKKENKELLSYLLYGSRDEASYAEEIRSETDALFDGLRYTGAYAYTKQLRKILRYVSKHCKYSGNPATEAELLIHFCKRLMQDGQSRLMLTAVQNLLQRQIAKAEKAVSKLHEDLQYDFAKDLSMLKSEQF